MATIQIRDLPDEVVRTLKRRAVDDGKSLQQYMRTLLEDLASRPTMEEIVAQIESELEHESPRQGPSSASILRELRDEREEELARRVRGDVRK